MLKISFSQLPQDLKFLKSENYESLLIKRLVKKFALINISTQFNLFIDKKRIINTSKFKHKTSKNIFYHRVSEILGSEFLENSIEIYQENKGIIVRGLLGIPTLITQIQIINLFL